MFILKGALALSIRYVLLIGGGALAGAGIITQTGVNHFCFDAKTVADAAAVGATMIAGGGAATSAGVVWRWWAKKRGGVT
jgi:hypothetical protein